MKKVFWMIIILGFFMLFVIGVKKVNDFQDYNPTVIVEDHKFDSKQNKELLTGDKVSAEFKAKHDRLGSISIKFNTNNRINYDYLLFSIKKIGSNHWYYSNKYNTDQFHNNQYFPFGFPQINDSKDKGYQLQIESLRGIKGNSVQAVMENSPFLSRYSFPKAYLQQNKKEILPFIFSKVKSYFSHIGLNVYLSVLVLSLLFLYLLRLVNINKLLDSLNRLDKVINKLDNNPFLVKLKENKIINFFSITTSIFILFIVNLSINGPIRLKALAFSDDLNIWNVFNSNRNNIFGFIFNIVSILNKFRPVSDSVFFVLFNLIGGKIWLFGIFLLMFSFLISVILFLLFRKISNNIFVSLCLSVAFILSRFSYFVITQALGLIEAISLLLSSLLLYLLWRYLNTEKIKYLWISIVMFLLLLLTHERFVTLLFLYFVAFLLLKPTRKNILLFFASALPVIFVWGIKIFFLPVSPFLGTNGANILQTFKISSFLQFFLSGWLYLFGINAGPTYLNGISSDAVPQNINTLILIGSLCLLLIFTFFGLIVFKTKKILLKNYLNHFVLFFSFVFLTLIGASVTVRLDVRWLYAPYVGLLFLLAYMIGVIFEKNISGKFCLLLFILWLGMVVPIELFYRTNYKNLYYWEIQTIGNSLYETTLEKYSNDFWNYKTYVVCAEKTSQFMLSCNDFSSFGDLNLFFKQFETKGVKANIYLINKVSKITPVTKGSKILVLIYDRQKGKFVDLRSGNELRKANLVSGWYGWNDGKISIWAEKDAEALFQTGDKGKMTFEGFLPKYNLPNTVTFFIDDKLVSKFYVEDSEINFQIEAPKNKIINLKIDTVNTKSPAELKVGADLRELGILVTDIKFE